MQRVVGAYSETKLGKVGSSNRDRSRFTEAFNEWSISGGDEISKNRETLGCRSAGYVYVFFYCARDTMEGTEFIPSGYGFIRIFRSDFGFFS
tara:strand:- start:343 stop:618 length:276 start_codon:yes stop_codon:yes gene_type:complete